MAEKKRVNLTVNPETKAEWDNAVEESTEYSSLSDLIRQSVAHELSDSRGAATAQQGRATEETTNPEANTEILEQVTSTLDGMETTLSNLDDRLTNVEQEVTATAHADLRNAVFNSLPKYDSDDGPDGKSAEEIAEEIGENKERVFETIQKLEEQTGVIREVLDVEGEQLWARDDDR
jgi:Arc/MetJ-type ribon-helix-helix transcriptional regulator